jgi:Zn-dependent peptidase ImmA (M78 family)
MTPPTTPSVLACLRHLAPGRPLTVLEALRVAEQQANRLLELGHIFEPPVPMALITELPHIRVEDRSGLPVAGSAHWTDGDWIIRLATDDHPRRRRFSLAHEFKHILDHPNRQVLYAGFSEQNRQSRIEQIADAFAADLLMPKKLIRQAFTTGIQDPYHLARLFEVSPAAMRLRLSRLGLAGVSAGCDTTWRRSQRSPHTDHGVRL